jgi:glycolate oxidase FAD binding subunit
MAISNPLRSQLNEIVGEAGILPDDMIEHYQIDDINPQTVVLPASVPEIQDILAFAANRKLSVIPAGSGTKLGIGNPLEKVDLVVSMARLDEILEYEPADLTVTVQSGVRLATLQELLAEQGQFLPLDPPYMNLTTVGGIVSANASGPSRIRYGTARNRVLGMRVVQSSGAVVKSGGKVVKNVAGYDLRKLYIGAFGTLGIITELTFNLYPLPEIEQTMLLTFDEIGQAAKMALGIAGSQLSPTFLNLFINDAPATETSGISLAIGLDGYPETVAWEIDWIHSLVKQNGGVGVKILESTEQQEFRATMRAFPEQSRVPQKTVCKANLRLADVEGFMNAALETVNALQTPIQLMGLMGTGVVYVAISGDLDGFQSTVQALATLRKHATNVGGNLIIESAPVAVKRQMDAWGKLGTGVALMKQIKAKLDPIGLLNPGRFVEGI